MKFVTFYFPTEFYEQC